MSKYKVGDKFIIEIDEEFCNGNYGVKRLYKAKGFNSLVFDENGLDKLQKLNPKLKIEDIDDMLAEHDLKKEAYEKGLNDAWVLMGRLAFQITKDICEQIFGYKEFEDVLDHFSPQQALAKIEAYEKSHQIQVGDVVETEKCNGVVIDQYADDRYYILTENGCIEDWCYAQMAKTGKHIDIEHLLEQIRGE